MYGYNIFMIFFFDWNFGIFIVMIGEDKKDFFRIVFSSYILDLYFEKELWLNFFLFCMFFELFMKGFDFDIFKVYLVVLFGWFLIDFIGMYINDIYGKMEIIDKSGVLEVKYGYVIFDF